MDPRGLLEQFWPDEHASKHYSGGFEATSDPDAEFGGTEARKELEKRLLRKVDIRMSILVVIYILNYVSCTWWTTLLMFRDTNSIQMDRNNAA